MQGNERALYLLLGGKYCRDIYLFGTYWLWNILFGTDRCDTICFWCCTAFKRRRQLCPGFLCTTPNARVNTNVYPC